MSGQANAVAPTVEASGGSQPMPTRPAAGLALIAIAALVLAAGASLVGAGVAWAPSRDAARAISSGAQLYAAECAGCHGARLEDWDARTQPHVRKPRSAPSLGQTGHAWQHSDAELAAIVALGTGGIAPPGNALAMPAFMERLSRSDIDAILAYVKSGWPGSIRAYQAALNPGGEKILAALLHDPAWVFPGQCLPPAAATDGR